VPGSNIILIGTDQQRADTIHHGGAHWMRTPNLHRLAGRGVLFRNAFCSAATCVASRAAFYTGLYGHATGIFGFDRYTGRQNWTHRLREAGYRTVSIGKTHINGPHHGYDQRLADQGNKYSPSFVGADGREESLWAKELRAAGLEPPLEIEKTMPNFFENLGATAICSHR